MSTIPVCCRCPYTSNSAPAAYAVSRVDWPPFAHSLYACELHVDDVRDGMTTVPVVTRLTPAVIEAMQ